MRPARTVAYLLILLLATVWLAERHQPPPDPIASAMGRDVSVMRMEETLASLRASVSAAPDTMIVLGDSSLLEHWVLTREESLAFLLETDAPRAGLSVRVVAHNGFDPVAYYLLADELAALRPRAVVLTANLQAFTDSWFRSVRMKHPQLAAFVRLPRTLEAMALPLDLAGISDASLVIKPLLRPLGAAQIPDMLERYRERFRAQLDRGFGLPWATVTAGPSTASAALEQPSPEDTAAPATAGVPPQPAAGEGRTRPGKWRRPRVPKAYQRLDLYPDHLEREQAAVQVLEATLQTLVARGLRTVVLIAPLHVQALQMVGAYQQRDLAGAVTLIRDVVVESGATPLDLSQALPREDYFTDAHTHFTAEGNRIVATQIIAALQHVLTAPSHLDPTPP